MSEYNTTDLQPVFCILVIMFSMVDLLLSVTRVNLSVAGYQDEE